jgi:hypothetical protein
LDPCPPILCFRLDVYIHLVQPPPRGIQGFTGKQVTGVNMAADAVFQGTEDIDPNAVSGVTSFLLNGVLSPSTFTRTVIPGQTSPAISYMGSTPTPPPLVAGDTVQARDVTSDNQTPPLSSPPFSVTWW